MDEPDDQDEIAIRALIAETYAATSSGRPGTARYIAHPDIAIAGSGQGELVRGPGSAARMADGVTNLGYLWTPDEISVGRVVVAQILGHVTVRRDGTEEVVPYRTTGVFGRDRTDGPGGTGAGPNRRRSHGLTSPAHPGPRSLLRHRSSRHSIVGRLPGRLVRGPSPQRG